MYSYRAIVRYTYFSSVGSHMHFDMVIILFVTGFWKTDQTVTLGLFHFLAQVIRSYTHTPLIHSTITRLGWLVYFSSLRASFVDCINSWLRQWDPWRALHGRHGSEIDPSSSETSHGPSKHVWACRLALLELIASPNSPNRGFNPSLAAHPPPPLTPTDLPLIRTTGDITVVVKNLLKIQQC